MLMQLLIHQPSMLGSILARTPAWVWGLLAALLTLGLSQLRTRMVGLTRVALLPAAMTALSLWGTASALGNSPHFGTVVLVWLATAALALAITAAMNPPTGARYETATRSFSLPGSWVPLLLIVSIFLTRYVVNVELAIQPGLARDAGYVRAVAALYGLFSGVFIGRAARLWRLALRAPLAAAASPNA